jgi:hypothetical protein
MDGVTMQPPAIGIRKWGVFALDDIGGWNVAFYDTKPVGLRSYEVIIKVPDDLRPSTVAVVHELVKEASNGG